MSVAGLRKQFHKASQFVSEKMGGAEGTKLDEEFTEMEKQVDLRNKAVVELIARTQEYLQPNPASRAKLGMLNTMSKIRGQVKTTGYPQPEGVLGDAMLRFGHEMGNESQFGQALVDVGESLKQLSEAKDALDISVKQNFIDPLQSLQDKELREIGHHLKKLEGRRLDFDYKKKRQGKVADDEIRQAAEKFDESRDVTATSMSNLLESEVEQVSQLEALVEAQLEYHRQVVDILDDLQSTLQDRVVSASARPRQRREFKLQPVVTFDGPDETEEPVGTPIYTPTAVTATTTTTSAASEVPPAAAEDAAPASPSPSPGNKTAAPLEGPCCRALYDFDAENEGELAFREGDVVSLVSQVDDNWFEGAINGRPGFFPVNYVEVLVPLAP
ncbi:endophilin-A3-like isoform X1 [Petromyzon marinus]|uniref:endophilin-A3-like isoform X1 n=2 Tax=Petromyzon marinus TaxID=7757 RepID=UPI003F70A9E1